MRVAIFHDYFSFIGGGEKLVLTLARHLKADIITTNVDYESDIQDGLRRRARHQPRDA